MKVVKETELKRVPRWVIEAEVAKNQQWNTVWSEESHPRESGPRKEEINGIWRAQLMGILADTDEQFVRLLMLKVRRGERIENLLFVRINDAWLQVTVQGRTVVSSQWS